MGREAIWTLSGVFQDIDGVEFEVGNPSREGFAGLPHERHGGRAQEQKLTRAVFFSAFLIDDASYGLENLWKTVDLI